MVGFNLNFMQEEFVMDCPFGIQMQKYWDVRFDLFSKFDEGVKIDVEGLYSAKPEEISYEVAAYLKGNVVLDAFGGVGASAIGFARRGKKVICVENNAERYEIIKNNVNVYGLNKQITVIHDDIMMIKDDLIYDSVYLDPPWGGPSYRDKKYFKLDNFQPNGKVLLDSFFTNKGIMLTVPKNFDFNEVAHLNRDYCVKWAQLNNKIVFANLIFE